MVSACHLRWLTFPDLGGRLLNVVVYAIEHSTLINDQHLDRDWIGIGSGLDRDGIGWDRDWIRIGSGLDQDGIETLT